ncbi:hypothetical protein GS887_27800 [Rhodococcus hoagii]|nr:hypothetical protein [Prescottella equi]
MNAELVTNDNPSRTPSSTSSATASKTTIRYATVRLAIEGDLDDVMCVEMPLHDLESGGRIELRTSPSRSSSTVSAATTATSTTTPPTTTTTATQTGEYAL